MNQGIKIEQNSYLRKGGKTAFEMLVYDRNLYSDSDTYIPLTANRQLRVRAYYDQSTNKINVYVSGTDMKLFSFDTYQRKYGEENLIVSNTGGCEFKVYQVSESIFIATYRTNISGYATKKTIRAFKIDWTKEWYNVTLGSGLDLTAANAADLTSDVYLLTEINAGFQPTSFIALRADFKPSTGVTTYYQNYLYLSTASLGFTYPNSNGSITQTNIGADNSYSFNIFMGLEYPEAYFAYIKRTALSNGAENVYYLVDQRASVQSKNVTSTGDPIARIDSKLTNGLVSINGKDYCIFE